MLGAWTLLAMWACLRDFRSDAPRTVPEWTRTNMRWSIVLIALLPVQFMLLHNDTLTR
jgi:hypothetical protein